MIDSKFIDHCEIKINLQNLSLLTSLIVLSLFILNLFAGFYFGIWIASKKSEKGVCVDRKKLRQYKQVAHYIQTITPEELRDLGPLVQFPVDVFEDKD